MENLIEELEHILILSDKSECNEHLSIVLKRAVDYLSQQSETHHKCSIIALKILQLNLFVKNFTLCLGKYLGLLSALSYATPGDLERELSLLRELILISVYLLLKLKEDSLLDCLLDEVIDNNAFYSAFSQFGIVNVVGGFISGQIASYRPERAPHILLKLSCDIIFQYLYHVVLLTDDELAKLTSSDLVPMLIDDLLSNDHFNNYEISGDDFEDESRLIAYEEFKLLLLINEQYLMKSLSCQTNQNTVFERLMASNKDGSNGMCGFANLAVYHLNREKSQILQILNLKFLYLIFTSLATAKLIYLNDVKILVDIIIRELDNYSYHTADKGVLILTFLKVLYPVLKFSDLANLNPPYKAPDILDVLRNIVLSCDVGSASDVSHGPAILKCATICLSIPWLNNRPNKLTSNPNASSESVASASSLTYQFDSLKLDRVESPASDSSSFTIVASVTTSSFHDYNAATTMHNEKLSRSSSVRGNIFSSDSYCALTRQDTEELLDIPRELLEKELPPLPPQAGHKSFHSTFITTQQKARQKKAPPPPPPPPRTRRR